MLVGDICNSMRRIVTVIALAIALLGNAQAFRGGEIFRIRDSDIFWAAVKTVYFVESVARQEEDHWCWAACVQMVLNYQGVDVDQDDIVLQAFGSRINRGGSCYDIARGADGWHTRNRVIRARVESPAAATARSFVNDLVNKYPLIIGLEMPGQTDGHAYVLTGISFRTVNGEYRPIEVILRDPWPTSPSRKKIPWSDFRRRVHTIVHVYPQ